MKVAAAKVKSFPQVKQAASKVKAAAPSKAAPKVKAAAPSKAQVKAEVKGADKAAKKAVSKAAAKVKAAAPSKKEVKAAPKAAAKAVKVRPRDVPPKGLRWREFRSIRMVYHKRSPVTKMSNQKMCDRRVFFIASRRGHLGVFRDVVQRATFSYLVCLYLLQSLKLLCCCCCCFCCNIVVTLLSLLLLSIETSLSTTSCPCSSFDK